MCGLVMIFVASALARVLATYLNGPVHQISDTFTLVWPVSWRLYVNPDQSQFVVAYAFDNNGFRQLTHSTASGADYWGLDHSTYGDLVRVGAALQSIPPGVWRNCAAPDVADCASIIAAAPHANVPSPFASACGPTVFTAQRPGTRGEGYAPQVVRVAVVDLTCQR